MKFRHTRFFPPRRIPDCRLVRRLRAGRRGREPASVWAFLLITAAIIGFLLIQCRIGPLVQTFAAAQAEQIASRAIYDSMEQAISEEGISYNDLMVFQKDGSGNITALSTNIVNVNRLKSQFSLKLIDALNVLGSSEIGVPLGNLVGGGLFSGRGPEIPVKLVPVGSMDTELINDFTAAGINQTKHQIKMKATVHLDILLPGRNAQTDVSAVVEIGETVIVGKVPGSYTNVYGDNNPLISKINDYAGK